MLQLPISDNPIVGGRCLTVVFYPVLRREVGLLQQGLDVSDLGDLGFGETQTEKLSFRRKIFHSDNEIIRNFSIEVVDESLNLESKSLILDFRNFVSLSTMALFF